MHSGFGVSMCHLATSSALSLGPSPQFAGGLHSHDSARCLAKAFLYHILLKEKMSFDCLLAAGGVLGRILPSKVSILDKTFWRDVSTNELCTSSMSLKGLHSCLEQTQGRTHKSSRDAAFCGGGAQVLVYHCFRLVLCASFSTDEVMRCR